jgi:outer membrane immunogenic protein
VKKILIGAIVLIAGGASAIAADLPARTYTKAPAAVPQAIYDWTGFYIGGNGGGVWGGGRSSLVNFTSDGYDLGPAFKSSSSSSWLAGVHGGYNWQTASRIVLGLEGDFEGTNLRHSNNGTLTAFGGLPFGTSLWNMSDRLNWLASVRGRLGYAVDKFMPYVTGGAAWSNVNYSGFVTNNLAAAGGYGPYNQTTTKTGWVAGVGGEYAFASNWIARLEYLHYGFGGETLVGVNHPSFVPGARGVFTVGSTGYDTVRAGISYKFGGPVVARY